MIKKKSYIFVLLLLTAFLYPEKYYLADGTIIEGEIIKNENNKVSLKTIHGTLEIDSDKFFESKEAYDYYIRSNRHMFSFSWITGFSIVRTEPKLETTNIFCGPAAGFTFDYYYAFNNYFAIGTGVTFFLAFNFNYIYQDTEWFQYQHIGFSPFTCSGGMLTLDFMIGDIRQKRIAFIFDFGGGWMFSAKIGFMIKNFMFKAGYAMTYFNFGHNITIDTGFKINYKPKNLKQRDN